MKRDSDQMDFWCWIPHIHTSLDGVWSDEEIEDILVGTPDEEVRFGLHVDDDHPDKFWVTTFTVIDGKFEYDKRCLRCVVDDCNGNSIAIDIEIRKNGNIIYGLDVGDSDEDYYRHLVNELNYLIKNLLHDHVYHESDPIHDLSKDATNTKVGKYNEHADYYISPVRASKESEAIDEIDKLFAKSLDKFIEKWKSMEKDVVVPENERKLAYGYVIFGKSFCNCTRDQRGADGAQKMERTLDLYKSVIEDITEDAKRKEARIYSDDVNRNIMRLTICSSLLTIVSIIVAYFAGSSLAKMLEESDVTAIVTISIGIVTIIIIVCIFSVYGIWNVFCSDTREPFKKLKKKCN